MFLSLLCALVAAPCDAQLRFDPATVLGDLQRLSCDGFEGRGVGTDGGSKARAYIERAFRHYRIRPFHGSYRQSFVAKPGRPWSPEGVNVFGYVKGTDHSKSYIVLTAHYDHLGIWEGEIYNGADDNASGVAALLAAAQYFSAHPLRHSLILAAMDAEEIGQRGARVFLRDPPVARNSMLLNVNMDMLGHSSNNVLFAAGTYHYPFTKPALEKVAARSRIRLRYGHDRADGSRGSDWTSASDHIAFHKAGIPFVYFGVADHRDYHRASDTFERIDQAFLIAAVETILDAVTEFDSLLENQPSR